MRLNLAFLALAACAPASTLPQTSQQAPPGATLDVAPLLSGVDTTMVVEGAPANAEVTYLLSTRGRGNEPCHPNGVCGSLAPRVIFVGRKTADAAGNASITRRVPPTWDDHVITFQAYVAGSGVTEMTNVVERLIGDDDLDMVHDTRDNCLALANPAQIDQDGDTFGAACDCDDTNTNINPSIDDPTTDGLDQNCDGVDGPLVDYQGTYEGDFVYVTEAFGLVAPCYGDFSFTYDVSASTQLLGDAMCVSNGLLGQTTVLFELTGTVDAAGNIDALFDDYAGSVQEWTGTFSGSAPNRTIIGQGAGMLTFGTFTVDLDGTEL